MEGVESAATNTNTGLSALKLNRKTFFFMFKETKYTPNIQIKRKILHFFLNLKKKEALYTEYLLIETLKYN